ncbi:TolC family protein [Stenotrophomonas sp. 24(2023)]|uniref:TolC family protein n=1 Tax=Stenotrophomonas sp. 24(2023) TaxID=3068324 RepID=UPI0027DF8C34|nr:TolC family protein [Stenotrophomonas sp. 24(2023)]WMJ71496.1 TolC family protein [Stenotrophomonas sp. 24(2023)]
MLAGTALAQGQPAPSQVPALDWAQASARLLQVSDALAAADASVRNKEDLQDATRLLRLPEITGEVRRMEFQKSLSLPLGSLAPVAEAFGIDSPLRFAERDWRTRPIVTAVLPLYSGGLIPAAQQAAAGATAQAHAERDAQQQSLAVQLAQAYFGQRLAEQAVQVRREVRDGLDRHLADALKLEREGFATRAQRLQANVARDKAEREYQKSLNDLQTLQAALATLLRSGGEVQPLSPLFVHRVPIGNVAEFERIAQSRQPQIARLQAMVAQAEQGVRAQQAKLKPQVFLFGTYDFRRRDALLTDPDWAFGIGVKYTFLSPSSRPAQISAARAQQEQAEAGLREAGNQVALGVRKAWNELETARHQFVLLDSSIEQARENLRLQELAFREGQATSLDVIDARLGLGGAQVERAQAAYQYDIALAQLLEISGQMDRFDEFRRRADEVIAHE